MIVVDTNILAYNTLPGPNNAATDELSRHDPEWAAPLLWRSEFRNILAGYIRRGDMNRAAAVRTLSHAAASLLGGEHRVADEDVLELVSGSRCSAYDCEFMALANSIGTILVTEDRELLKAFPIVARSLSEAAGGNLSRG